MIQSLHLWQANFAIQWRKERGVELGKDRLASLLHLGKFSQDIIPLHVH